MKAKFYIVATLASVSLLGIVISLVQDHSNPSRSPSSSIDKKTFHFEIATDKMIADVDERFLSFSVDSSQVLGGQWWNGKSHKSVTPYDFTRPKLRLLTHELSPAYLRIGGTDADKTFYDLSSESFIGEKAPRGYALTLTRPKWDEINTFAKNLNLKIIFGLNAGPSSRNRDWSWNSTNARELVRYTNENHYPVSVWEFGNELNGYFAVFGLFKQVTGFRYSEDLKTLRQMLTESGSKALLAGPDSSFWPHLGEPFSLTPSILENRGVDLLDIYTWHYYPQQSHRCPVATRRAKASFFLNPKLLDESGYWAGSVQNHLDQAGAKTPVWLGETSNALCGGEPGLSDRFISGFWWLDELGQMARAGQKVVIRQTLSGADYGLIDEQTLEPNPDYWNSVFWKRLMGTRVLETKLSEKEPKIRTYAHCTPKNAGYPKGAVSALVLNLNKEDAVELSLSSSSPLPSLQYWVQSEDLLGKTLMINGHNAVFRGGSYPLLPEPVRGTSSLLVIPKASYVFVVYPEAGARACL